MRQEECRGKNAKPLVRGRENRAGGGAAQHLLLEGLEQVTSPLGLPVLLGDLWGPLEVPWKQFGNHWLRAEASLWQEVNLKPQSVSCVTAGN